MKLYYFVRALLEDFFIQQDRPEHAEMRQMLHSFFTPKAMEKGRPLVQSAIEELLDESEQQGRVDRTQDFATPMSVSVIAQLTGIPYQERLFIYQPGITFRPLNSLPMGWI
jgi:cytochrome P450